MYSVVNHRLYYYKQTFLCIPHYLLYGFQKQTLIARLAQAHLSDKRGDDRFILVDDDEIAIFSV